MRPAGMGHVGGTGAVQLQIWQFIDTEAAFNGGQTVPVVWTSAATTA